MMMHAKNTIWLLRAPHTSESIAMGRTTVLAAKGKLCCCYNRGKTEGGCLDHRQAFSFSFSAAMPSNYGHWETIMT